MKTDPIVSGIREAREAQAARFGYDIRAIVKDAQMRDASGDRKVVRLQPRRPPEPVHGTASVESKSRDIAKGS